MWPESSLFTRQAADEQQNVSLNSGDASTTEKHAVHDTGKAVNSDDPESVSAETNTGELPAEIAQPGVKKVEAMMLVWTKASLATVLCLIFLMYFMNAFQASITGNLTAYVVSAFEAHSLIPVMYIVSNIMAGALRLTVAKMLDLWGRPQGFAVMVSIATMGLILMAVCKNVQTFAAAQIFYSVGFDGTIYSADVVTADSTTLRNRGLAFAFTASPYIITAFAGPKAAEGFYEDISWRWAFGTFAILFPIVALPLWGTLFYHQKKAKAKGLLRREKSGRSLYQSIWHYLIEFDALGIFLFASGFALFLLPFSLAESAGQKWREGYIIAMLVLGVVLLITFGLCEKFVASKPFLPFHLLVSRTVLGTCLLSASYQISYYCWGSYFSSYLQVVHGLTIAQAGYVSGVFDIISGCWIFVVGFAIRKSNHFKWILLIAIPLDLLGIGLMIKFRNPDWSIGYVIMCQVFIALSGGMIILTQQISIMSAGTHGDIAALLALLGLFGYMGGAIGNTISGAIWTNTLPGALEKHLPEEVKANATAIYDDLKLQLQYPRGNPIRDGIVLAYGDAQRNMCIAGVAVMALSLIWVLLIKNINVSKVKQVKGIVF